MSVLLVVNTAPYGSEGPYNAFRLADALAVREEHVEVFLMGDAVPAARTPLWSRCSSTCWKRAST